MGEILGWVLIKYTIITHSPSWTRCNCIYGRIHLEQRVFLSNISSPVPDAERKQYNYKYMEKLPGD